MASNLWLFSSESVAEGYPDKTCDSISDSILNAIPTQGSTPMVAVEIVVTTDLVHIVGEIRTKSCVDILGIVRGRLEEIGFDSSEKGFDGKTYGVFISIGEQSSDIRDGMHTSLEAHSSDGEVEAEDLKDTGDQGPMFGYATNETPEYMLLSIALAHRLACCLTQVHKKGIVPSFWSDDKAQATFTYDEDNNSVYLGTTVAFTQHDLDVTRGWIAEQIKVHIADWVLDDASLHERFAIDELKLLVNPPDQFIIGGLTDDAGPAGHKIIVDTRGGMAHHGGGTLSGKGPLEVDHSAAYATRRVAKNVVAASLADHFEIQIVRAIGRVCPIGFYVDSFGTGHAPDNVIRKTINKVFNPRPVVIIRDLDLLRPAYVQTSVYGYFGRTDLDLPREQLNRVEELRVATGLG